MPLAAVADHARRAPQRVALVDDAGEVRYPALAAAVEAAAAPLADRVVGVLMDNGAAWLAVDLAIAAAGATGVALPPFFTEAQLRHVIDDAGIDCLVTDRPRQGAALLGAATPTTMTLAGRTVWCLRRPRHRSAALPGIARVTYTSGTTGEPRGVCLPQGTVERVVASLREAVEARPGERFLSLLPLAILLDNVAALVALASGGTACVPALAAPSGHGAASLCRHIERHRPHVLVLVPALLRQLLGAVEAGWRPPSTLRLVAVGGAPVSPLLLERAAALGLPVYEGYGLSEAASVVALNRPGAHRRGSVGRPLPHAEVRIAPDGEVLVRGATFSHYLGDRPRPAGWLATGDLGRVDGDGFLHLEGRKSEVLVTTAGRNVSPEWVERELTASTAIARACVVGHGRPHLAALIEAAAGAGDADVRAAVDAANARLPEYAAVRRYCVLDRPFTSAAGESTATGRLRRRVIARTRAELIESLYEETDDVVLSGPAG